MEESEEWAIGRQDVNTFYCIKKLLCLRNTNTSNFQLLLISKLKNSLSSVRTFTSIGTLFDNIPEHGWRYKDGNGIFDAHQSNTTCCIFTGDVIAAIYGYTSRNHCENVYRHQEGMNCGISEMCESSRSWILFKRKMQENLTIIELSRGAFAINLRFQVEGTFARICNAKETFCVNDYGSFPPSIAQLLLDSEVSAMISLVWTDSRANMHAFSI